MIKGRKFYIHYDPYLVFTLNGKSTIRRLYDDNKEKRTGKIRLNSKMETVNYY